MKRKKKHKQTGKQIWVFNFIEIEDFSKFKIFNCNIINAVILSKETHKYALFQVSMQFSYCVSPLLIFSDTNSHNYNLL